MLAVAAIIFASNHIIGRHLNEILPPFGTAFWRFTIGGIVMLPLAGRSFYKHWPLIKQKLPLFIFLAILFVPLSNGFIYLSYHWTTAINGGVVSTVQPAMTIALSAIIFRDLINLKQALGLVAATTGVLVIISRGNPTILLQLEFNFGDLTLIFAMFAAALYNVLLRLVPAEISMPLLLLIVQLFGTIATLPIYAVETIWLRPVPFTFDVVLVLLWIGIAVTALAVGLNNAVIRSLGANKASIGNYLRATFTALLAILFLGEDFQLYHGFALILVLGGSWLLSMGRSINQNR